jgi:flagellar protein FlgJ
MTRDQFFATLAPHAIRARLDGSPLFVSVRLAQNLLETGGTIPSWNNLGGYKVGSGKPNGYWRGKVVNKGTWEVYDGKRVDIVAAFRAYDSIYDFYKDQDLLFQLSRYERVRTAKTPREQAEALQACGYATDPDYASKLVSIIRTYGLKQYDEEAKETVQLVEELKSKVDKLQQQVLALQKEYADVSTKVGVLLDLHKIDEVPNWAREAVDAAVAAGVVDTPNGGSLDFYRVLTVLHRRGLI